MASEAVDDEDDSDKLSSSDGAAKNVNFNKTTDYETEKKVTRILGRKVRLHVRFQSPNLQSSAVWRLRKYFCVQISFKVSILEGVLSIA